MYSKDLYYSSRGYYLELYRKGPDQLNGWFHIPVGKAPVKIPLKALCKNADPSGFEFCSFVGWAPYFDDIISSITGRQKENHIMLKWVMLSGLEKDGVNVISHGTDVLYQSTYQNDVAELNSENVPHPFQLSMLDLSSSLSKVHTHW